MLVVAPWLVECNFWIVLVVIQLCLISVALIVKHNSEISTCTEPAVLLFMGHSNRRRRSKFGTATMCRDWQSDVSVLASREFGRRLLT